MGIDPSDTKERPLRLVAELLNRESVAYALIGGVAIQIRTTEPRTTLDINVAVPRFADVPPDALLAAGTSTRCSSPRSWSPGCLDAAVRITA
jgi:hypothetical protein